MINIEISEPFQDKVDKTTLYITAKKTLEHQAVPSSNGLSILITTDQQIHDYNLRFRGIDSPTDVLSFNLDQLDPDDDTQYLGDVVISYPTASAQAQIYGHGVTEELQLLIIHGILHLLGYDHAKPADKTRMWKVQKEILSILELDNIAPSE